jgi:hypothetical protein
MRSFTLRNFENITLRQIMPKRRVSLKGFMSVF